MISDPSKLYNQSASAFMRTTVERDPALNAPQDGSKNTADRPTEEPLVRTATPAIDVKLSPEGAAHLRSQDHNKMQIAEIASYNYRFRDEDGAERLDLAAAFERVPDELKGFVASMLETRHLRFATEAAYARDAAESEGLAKAWTESRANLTKELSNLI